MNLVQQLKKEGRMEGQTEGKQERSREIAIEMLKDGIGIEQITKFTKLTKEDVLELKKSLEDGHQY